ncbi:MAG: hypothetical protein KAJ19_13570 [Gammaproteobacteria bacterium]|nr:hypothetical protein [Gammaproteobacteria bacterium]
MKKHEFEEELRQCDMNKTCFAILVNCHKDTIYKWGKNGEDLPHWVSIIMRLIRERRAYRDLFRNNK